MELFSWGMIRCSCGVQRSYLLLFLFPLILCALQDAKVCFSDDTLPDGYDVRRGQVITYQPYAMGRMEYLWGEDAEAFRPERWLDANGAFCPQSPFKFTAFQVMYL